MSQEEVNTILEDVFAEHGEFGKAIAKEYIKQQQISY